ncbi:MAG TPA: hypothetical protein H9909_00020 [Candidatus Mediterraneibacter norfolkensis]|nr:hypothetical protein [Candidatus Mediterraneibacter norfolkensis]
MYIRKSVLKAAVLTVGSIILAALAALYCFTETNIPSAVYLISWLVCLYAMLTGMSEIDRR